MTTNTDPRPPTHTFMDRLLGRHNWRITHAFWHFRGGGTATFQYECFCGQLQERHWAGEHGDAPSHPIEARPDDEYDLGAAFERGRDEGRREAVREIEAGVAAFQKPLGWSAEPPPWLRTILDRVAGLNTSESPRHGRSSDPTEADDE